MIENLFSQDVQPAQSDTTPDSPDSVDMAELRHEDKKTDLGGIEMNEIGVDRQGSGVNIEFKPEAIEPFLSQDFQGFTPVIINITPINSVLPLLGLAPARDDEEEELKISKAS